MQRFFKILFVSLAVAGLSWSCNKDGPSADKDAGGIRLSVCVSPSTRTTVTAEDFEKSVSHVDWFVYDGDGNLVTHQRDSGDSSELSVSSGTYTFFALVNYPSVISDSSVGTIADLTANITLGYSSCSLNPAPGIIASGGTLGDYSDALEDDAVFVMRSDLVEESVESGDSVEITVYRVADKVILEGDITYTDHFVERHGTKAGNPDAYKVFGAFVVNIPSTVKVIGGQTVGSSYEYDVHDVFSLNFLGAFRDLYPDVDTSASPSTWDMSDASFRALFPDWFLPIAYYPEVFSSNEQLSGFCQVFYVMPNPASESLDPTDDDYQTKIILWTACGFYSFPLPDLGQNMAIVIGDILIDDDGSEMPTGAQVSGAVRCNYSTLTLWANDTSLSADMIEN